MGLLSHSPKLPGLARMANLQKHCMKIMFLVVFCAFVSLWICVCVSEWVSMYVWKINCNQFQSMQTEGNTTVKQIRMIRKWFIWCAKDFYDINIYTVGTGYGTRTFTVTITVALVIYTQFPVDFAHISCKSSESGTIQCQNSWILARSLDASIMVEHCCDW